MAKMSNKVRLSKKLLNQICSIHIITSPDELPLNFIRILSSDTFKTNYTARDLEVIFAFWFWFCNLVFNFECNAEFWFATPFELNNDVKKLVYIIAFRCRLCCIPILLIFRAIEQLLEITSNSRRWTYRLIYILTYDESKIY